MRGNADQQMPSRLEPLAPRPQRDGILPNVFEHFECADDVEASAGIGKRAAHLAATNGAKPTDGNATRGVVRLDAEVIESSREPGAESAFTGSHLEDFFRVRRLETATNAAKTQPRGDGQLGLSSHCVLTQRLRAAR